MKTVGDDAFITYHVLNHYFKISKVRQKFKNSLIVKKAQARGSDIILNACMQYKNYPIKTVGEEAFYSYYIIHHYFKISKIRQNFKNYLIVKKITTQVSNIILDACMQFENFPIKTVGEEAFYSLIHIIPLFQNFINLTKIQK